ncbi:hypothetical protein [Achromobacter aloeverae]|uniref:Uncharacterized protein n=1 Tax=Achromobacter aloeverae TaxID=1750518 RepID=A0A4Q1HMG0_9BURK|nr:hypothetical protein [Achromobacter aloeverae]RXN90975.1 hypothetical protein C7R54_07145 [Achromobacter aloeverae]
MTGTLGAALSTGIWSLIAGTVLAWLCEAWLRRKAWPRQFLWVGRIVIVAAIVLFPQGVRLWFPGTFVSQYLPHTLTNLELRLLVKIAFGASFVGVLLAAFYDPGVK